MLLRIFELRSAVIAVCARQCRGSRCFWRALPATHAGASTRAVKHPRTSAGCRARGSPSCAQPCEGVLRGNWVNLLLPPGCEKRATSYAVLACHDRTRQSVSLSQVRARLREHRVAIEHAACAHRVEHLSGQHARSCREAGLAGGLRARSLFQVLGASPALAAGFQRRQGARERCRKLLQPSAPQAPGGTSAPVPCRKAMQVGASHVRSLAPPTGASPAPRGARHSHPVARERYRSTATRTLAHPSTRATGCRQQNRHGYRRASRTNSIRADSAGSRRQGALHAAIMRLARAPRAVTLVSGTATHSAPAVAVT